ncbi:MAG: helix-turn-helix transcriptional regulator [Candidatus Heimdallarchaeota archaeon]|nr:MAG: helix-turn-helix transcriptional regulator [Candidatus Heimdallarchaeota archaeon]
MQILLDDEENKGVISSIIDSIPLPQSAKRIFEILSQEGPLTSGDLEKRCTYSDRTIRNALKKLIGIGLVTKVANFSDMRTSLFHVQTTNAA